jgi:hypothetical protein
MTGYQVEQASRDGVSKVAKSRLLSFRILATAGREVLRE